jgi:hypothetical protein
MNFTLSIFMISIHIRAVYTDQLLYSILSDERGIVPNENDHQRDPNTPIRSV